MAQQYGAAQPIVDLANKAYDGMSKALNAVPSIERKPDTSWHDEMVKKANQSKVEEFQRKAVGKKPAKRVQKRTAPLSNKRTPRKRSQ